MEKVLMLSEKSVMDDHTKMLKEKMMLEHFVTTYLGNKKILVIRVPEDEKQILEELEEISSRMDRAFLLLDGKTLTPEMIREVDKRKDESLLVAVKNLSQLRNLDKLEEAAVIRAIMNMADPGNLELEFHKDSSFIFLAQDNFPGPEMASISLTWAYESVFLDCRDFRTKVMNHLKSYKEKFLRLSESVEYKGRKYDHILPEKYYEMNFSPEVSEKLISSKFLSTINWNRFSHHLNSSQVMAVNFFYPLIKHQELDVFLGLAGIDDEIIYDEKHIVFDKKSEKENTEGRRTCFDLYLKLKSGKEVYIKTNYTNGCYGRAVDEGYAERYREVYEPMLKGSDLLKEEYRTEAFFMDNYRFMRSIAHLDKNSHLIVIYPRENWEIREKSLKFKDEILEPEYSGNFVPIAWEELLGLTIEKVKDNNVAVFYDSWFKDKYFRY